MKDSQEEFVVFCGIDWAMRSHQVCVLDHRRTRMEQRSVLHDGESLRALAEWLIEAAGGKPAQVAVGIEVPHGAVVETLIEAGLAVFSINPKQLDRLRDRHTVAGAKDDRLDAFVLADAVATDRHLFRRVRIDPPRIIELREAGRMHDEIREQIGMASNRLRQQLLRFFPQVLSLGECTEPWIWDLIELVGRPGEVGKLRTPQIKGVLVRNRIRRHNVDSVLNELRKPALHVAPGTTEAASFHIQTLIEQLRLLHRQLQRCDLRSREILRSLSTPQSAPAASEQEQLPGQPAPSRGPCDVEILRSLPGVGDYVVATVLAEASQPLGSREYDTIRALAGVAPVTKRSGKSLVVLRRQASNPRLVDAAYFWGRAAIRADAAARLHYQQLRSKGHRHARALRGVIDRLLNVAIVMLRNRTLYDPSLRRRHTVLAVDSGAYPTPSHAA